MSCRTATSSRSPRDRGSPDRDVALTRTQIIQLRFFYILVSRRSRRASVSARSVSRLLRKGSRCVRNTRVQTAHRECDRLVAPTRSCHLRGPHPAIRSTPHRMHHRPLVVLRPTCARFAVNITRRGPRPAASVVRAKIAMPSCRSHAPHRRCRTGPACPAMVAALPARHRRTPTLAGRATDHRRLRSLPASPARRVDSCSRDARLGHEARIAHRVIFSELVPTDRVQLERRGQRRPRMCPATFTCGATPRQRLPCSSGTPRHPPGRVAHVAPVPVVGVTSRDGQDGVGRPRPAPR